MNHPDPLHLLALSVVNIGEHYAARVAHHATMTREQYEEYIRVIVSEEARRQYLNFGVRWSCHSIDDAVRDVCEHMDVHCAELSIAAVDAEHAGIQAVIKLQAALGVPQSAETARTSWQRMTQAQKSWTLQAAHDPSIADAVREAYCARPKP